MIWWSRQLAAPLGAKGARIVSVSPGSFDTRMGRLEEAKGAGALAEHSALGRFGKVQEIAEVLAFCASDKPGYLTGTDILVDGGPGTEDERQGDDRDAAEPLITRGAGARWCPCA